jgi:anti-sigma B factor antagonist
LLPEQEGVQMLRVDLSTPECCGPVVAALRGELDAAAAAGAEAAIAAAADWRPWVVADLTGLEFIDCSGLAALTRLREQAQRAGGDLLLAAVPEQVLRLLVLTELISVFSVHDSTGQAVAAVDRQPARPLPPGSRTEDRHARSRSCPAIRRLDVAGRLPP